jgi:two-component system invasion response regulator UvrY
MISLGLGGLDALETVRYLTHNHPRLPVVLLTTQGDGPFPKRLLELGARGFISRDSSAEEVERVFLAVLSGEKYISCEIAQKIALSMLPGGEHSPLDRLSEREMQIIMQLSHGESPQQISSRLALSPKTISTYKHRVKDKLSLKDTQEMYILTGKNGLG